MFKIPLQHIHAVLLLLLLLLLLPGLLHDRRLKGRHPGFHHRHHSFQLSLHVVSYAIKSNRQAAMLRYHARRFYVG